MKGNSSYSHQIGFLQINDFYQPLPFLGINIRFNIHNSSFYKNQIEKMYRNIHAEATTSSIQTVTNHSQFQCNTFRGQVTGSGMYNKTRTDIYIYKNNLVQQGAIFKSAGNEFSTLNYSGSFIYNIDNNYTPANNLIYYYSPTALNQDPQDINHVSKRSVYFSFAQNSCPAPTEHYELYNPYCGYATANPGNGILLAKSAVKGNLGNYKADMQALAAGGLDTTEKKEHDYLITEYNAAMLDLLEIYYDEMSLDTNGTAGTNRCYDSIVTYLNSHITPMAKYQLLAVAMERGRYTEASAYADSFAIWFPGDSTAGTQLKNYVDLLISYEGFLASTPTDSAAMGWLQSNFGSIKNIADDTTHIMAHKARVWVQQIANIDSTNTYHGDIIYPLYIHDAYEDDGTTEPASEFEVTIYPNPFADDGLHVQVENLTGYPLNYNINIHDMSGNFINEVSLTIAPSNTETADFNTETMIPGYYMLRIFDESGTEVYEALIYK